MIDKSERYLLDLFLASVKEDYYPSNDIEGIDFDKIYKLGSLNRVSNCLYYGLLKLNKDTLSLIPNLSKFKNECLIYGVKERVQDNEVNDIIKTFNNENIDIIFFKGYVLKHIYPKLDMRVMGDTDFLVRPEDLEKAKKVLENIGFKKDGDLDNNIEIAYKRNCEVELHKKLAISELEYFNDVFSHLVKFLDYSNVYTLDNEYHFIYLLSHAYTHIVAGGLGVKYPMDFYLYLNKYNIDLNKINKDLEVTNLDKFCKLILIICNKWFGLDLTKYQSFLGDFKLNEEEIEAFELFMLNGGEYGLYHDRYTYQKAANDNKLKYLLSKIFRPFRYVARCDHPKWWQYLLLPYYYLRHWIDFLFVKGAVNIRKAKLFIQGDEQTTIESLYKKIGVKKDTK